MTNQSQQLELNPEDCYIVVKFMGQGSALMDMFPVNTSALQMILAGQLLIEQGKATLGKESLKQAVHEVLEERNPNQGIIIPQARLPNAK